MDCIVWVSRVVCILDDEFFFLMFGLVVKLNELDEDEKDRIKVMNLEDSESE